LVHADAEFPVRTLHDAFPPKPRQLGCRRT
jgi:hypothetical protein